MVVHAEATLNEFRHTPRRRQERVQVRVECMVSNAADERAVGFQDGSVFVRGVASALPMPSK